MTMNLLPGGNQILFLLSTGHFVHVATFEHRCLSYTPSKGVTVEKYDI